MLQISGQESSILSFIQRFPESKEALKLYEGLRPEVRTIAQQYMLKEHDANLHSTKHKDR